MNVSGKTVLLTGATGGIGQAIARTFAGRGARLVLSGRRTDVLEPLAAETGGRAVACDLSDAVDMERLLQESGDVHVLIANAALPASGPVLEYSTEEIERALAVNLRSPIVMARLLAEQMVARREGHLVFVSSLSGKSAAPGTAIYSATKFGIRGFALGLREDLRPHGVGVSTVFPGFIRGAGMFAESGAQLPRGVGTKTPQEVADAVLLAVEKNRAEVDVAPIGLRAGAAFSQLAPELSATISRRLGSEKLSASVAEGQKSKRGG